MFSLHPRLLADCIELGDLPLCKLLLMNDSQYPWFILVPRKSEVTEVYELSQADQQQLSKESATLAKRLMKHYKGDKMNIAALGNVVPQLHIHHVVRFKFDPSWPDPVWGKHKAVPYHIDKIDKIKKDISMLLSFES